MSIQSTVCRRNKILNLSTETVRLGTARRWSDAEVDRSRAIFWANQYDTGLFSMDSTLLNNWTVRGFIG